MRAKITKVFLMDEEQIKRFMYEQGYDEGEYDLDEVENVLDTAEVDDLIPYADCPYALSSIDVR